MLRTGEGRIATLLFNLDLPIGVVTKVACPTGEASIKSGGVISLMGEVDGRSADGAAKKLGFENNGVGAAGLSDNGLRAVKVKVGAGISPDEVFVRFMIS